MTGPSELFYAGVLIVLLGALLFIYFFDLFINIFQKDHDEKVKSNPRYNVYEVGEIVIATIRHTILDPDSPDNEATLAYPGDELVVIEIDDTSMFPIFVQDTKGRMKPWWVSLDEIGKAL